MKLVSDIFYPEPHPILSKDSERREQRQMKNKVFQFDYAEPHPSLFKDSERCGENKIKNLFLII